MSAGVRECECGGGGGRQIDTVSEREREFLMSVFFLQAADRLKRSTTGCNLVTTL